MSQNETIEELETEVLSMDAKMAKRLAARYSIETDETRADCCCVPASLTLYVTVSRKYGLPDGKIAIKLSNHNAAGCLYNGADETEKTGTITYPMLANRNDVADQLRWLRKTAEELPDEKPEGPPSAERKIHWRFLGGRNERTECLVDGVLYVMDFVTEESPEPYAKTAETTV